MTKPTSRDVTARFTLMRGVDDLLRRACELEQRADALLTEAATLRADADKMEALAR